MANKAGTVWVDVRADTTGFLRDVSDGARKASSGLGGIVGTGVKTVMGDIATSAGVAAVGLGVVGAAAIKTSTDFNAAMSGVSAVAGATAQEMEMLREAALQAGADTAFSASEAATAQAELAKAGVSTADILGGALAGSLGLAAAGQLELGNAAEISAQALNIFNLEGSETTRVADVLAAGANKSAADVAQLGDALRQGGLVAKQTGLDLEDTVGVLSLFADNALIGSDAGTSLKTMLQRLVPQSDAAAESMKQLGLNFFDANGAFVGIEAVAQQLQDSLGGLSAEQQSAALSTLFGADAIRAASLLMNAGAAGVREYTTAVSDQGAAARMAAEQLNNLKGDLEEFSGATETALIRVGDLFDGLNRSVVQSATGLVNVFNDFATTPAWKRIQANFDGLAAAGGERIDQLSARLTGLLGNISPADVDRAFSAIEGAFAKIADSAEGLGPVIAGVGASLASLGGAAILGPLGGIVPTISPITGALAGLVLGSSQGRDALRQLGERAGEFATGTGAELLGALADLAEELSGGVASALSDVGAAVFDVADSLGPVLADAIEELGPPLGDLIESFGELAGTVLPVFADLAGTVIPPAVDVLGVGLQFAADAAGFLADNLGLLAPALGIFVATRYASQISAIGDAFRGAAAQVSFLRDSIGQIAATQGVSRLEALRGVTQATGREAGALAGSLIGALNPAVIGLTAAVTVGAVAYQSYADNKRKVAEIADGLAEAIRAERSEFELLADAQARTALENTESLATFNRLGVELADVVSVTANYGDEVSRLDDLWQRQGDNLDRFRAVIADLPAPVREIGESIASLVESGAIDQGEAFRFFEALQDLAAGSAEEIARAKAEFTSLAQEAAADGAITAQELRQVLDAIAEADTPDELNAAFNLLNGFLGTTADEARRAANEILGLIDELQALTGATVQVDEAERRLLDSFQSVLESFGQFGAGIDNTTEAGRRNADAIQQAVEAAFRLAEAQALVDTTGQSSQATLQNLADQLLGLRDAGLLTAEEYQKLLDLYGLTPTDIETTVNADTAEATAKLNDLRQQIETMPGVSEPVRAQLLAALNQGNLNQVESTIAFLARQREAIIRINPVLPDTSLLQGFPAFNPGNVRLQGRRASGGPVWSGSWLVGEEGPEIINLPAGVGGSVVPSDQSRQRVADAFGLPMGTDGASIAGPMNDPALLDELRRQSAEQAALRQSVDRLADSMAMVATRPQQAPSVEVNVADGMAVSARTRIRAMDR